IVPLATPARLAMSSIRVAAKPRATNSSIAASTMAARRSAARSARFGGAAAALLPPAPPPPGPAGADVLGVFAMYPYMTDQSVIIKKQNETPGSHRRDASARRSMKGRSQLPEGSEAAGSRV